MTGDGLTAARLARWFRVHARPLPWRAEPRNPYHALVSEAMLQQTQVSRVVVYFERFIARFPTVADLARADKREVLALWSGLGYYRRARSLHGAAREIVARFGGSVPRGASELITLPGIGRYTAGSIASIVSGEREPIVDGNVMRVLLRLNGRDLDPAAKTTVAWAWKRAEQLVRAAAPDDVGAFNEGLMELGATVCLPPPASPRCEACPLREVCAARAKGTQGRIPRAKAARTPSVVRCAAVVITDARGRVLLEQRPPGGMWASMWQCPTLESARRAGGADVPSARATAAPAPGSFTVADIAAFARLRGATGTPRRVGAFTHKTTHRTVRFTVYRAKAVACVRKSAGRVWRAPDDLADLGMSNAAKRVIAMGLAG
ncbi:MAG: A/G-specific adenine glycosylase [Chloroflexi bacterium]|nr:A/G-specific adenine glycosylase [Chloroflexota bacterium]